MSHENSAQKFLFNEYKDAEFDAQSSLPSHNFPKLKFYSIIINK